jgi:hypothetical protein
MVLMWLWTGKRIRKSPLARNNDGLPHPLSAHRRVGVFRDGKQMGLQIASLSTAIRLNDLRSIQSHTLERIDGDEYDSTICIDAVLGVTIMYRM